MVQTGNGVHRYAMRRAEMEDIRWSGNGVQVTMSCQHPRGSHQGRVPAGGGGRFEETVAGGLRVSTVLSSCLKTKDDGCASFGI